jgi:flagellar FliL protein
MRNIVIAVIIMLVLGGGGYFGWRQFNAVQPGLSVEEAELEPDIPYGNLEGQPLFIELDPLTAPFVRDGKFAHYVVLVVNLEVVNKDDLDKVRELLPRLRDAFVTELHTMATMRNPDQAMINIRRVKSRLLASADAVFGAGVVRSVLVQLAQ